MKKLIFLVAVGIALSCCSCSSTKYGCGKGAPKQNWNKLVKRINSPY